MRRAVVIGVALAALAAASPAAAAPAPPTGVTGIALDARVEVAWQPVVGATAYTVYRGTSATAINTLLTPSVGISATSFADTTAVNGTTYYYAVRSLGGGESANSLVVQATPRARSCSSGNAVVLENCFPGTAGWDVTNTSGTLEGFATATSINKGESVGLKVNAAAGSTFNIEIYRSGYYSDDGGRLFSIVRSVPGVAQPACSSDGPTGLLDCSNWSTSATITTTAAWPSGVYLLRLVSGSTDNHILLAVRDDARSSDLLYGVGFSTFQAYNNYGGKSLYDFNSSGNITVAGTARAVRVSFDRPFAQSRSPGLRDWYTRDEFASVRWLEQEGYDVAYTSNTDLEANPARVRNHRAYFSAAHDEYWSAGMRTALEQARDASPAVHLFFSGSNEVYWKIRYENGPNGGVNRVETCYKSIQSGGPDPSGIPTTTWRDPVVNKPENALSGVMYVGDNDSQYFPLVVSPAEGADRIYRYTALNTATSTTSIGTDLVGWEWDARASNGFEPAGTKTLASSPVSGNLIQNNGQFGSPGSTTARAVKYTAASGALVFSTGTNHWNRGLAKNNDGSGTPDVRIQQATTNVLSDMGVLPQTPASGITADDPLATTITVPTGLTAQTGGSDSVRLSWNAVSGATGYRVYRTTTARSGGLPVGTLVTGAAPVTGTSFTDISLAPSSTYYYVVAAAKGAVQSSPSSEASATTAVAQVQPVRINTGGPAYTSSTGQAFVADTGFTGGAGYTSINPIGGTNDPALYQNERWGQFSYAVLVPNGTYDVRFHFVELYYGSDAPGCVGKRIFGMDIVDTPGQDISNLDICATVGPNTALVRTVNGVAVSDGTLNIQSVYGSIDDPEVAAIEIVPAVAGPPTVTAKSPAAGATGVSTATTVTATFSRAMDASTINGTSFTLKRPDNTTVPATVSYNSGSLTATLTPSSALATSTTYTANLAATIKASDGQALASPVTWTFTTAAPPAPPTVTAKSPADGATGVSTATTVTATFSRSMDATTITTSSFTLTPSGGSPVAATVSYNSGSLTATLTPSSALAYSTGYTANLTTSIKASDGTPLASPVTWSFTTVAPPPPPTVTSTTPGNGATGVSTATTVTATFSRSMDATTITTSSFTLTPSGGSPVAATVSYNSGTNTATLTPSAALANSTAYTANLATSIKASDGQPLASPVSWGFTTAAPAPPPTVTSTSPANGATGVSSLTSVTATFSRSMDQTTITTSSFTLTPSGGSPVAATVSYNAGTNTATLAPSSALAGSTTYTANLAATIKASDGTPLASAVTWSFTTVAASGTTVRINSGGGAYTSSGGQVFGADANFTGGSTYISTNAISGTPDPALYQNERWGQFSYAIPVTNGTYDVRFHFVELYYGSVVPGSCVGKRVFGMNIVDTPGAQDISNLDICAQVGPNAALVKTVSGVAVSDGVLNIQSVYGSVDDPEVAAIEVIPSGPPGPPTVTAKSPADGSNGISTATTVTATFSRAMDPTTITASSFTLRRPDTTLVTATVSYDGATNTATLAPSAALAVSTTYTANLATTIKASDGTALASPVTWSFTTGTGGSGTTTARFNSGGGAYTTGGGLVFAADANFTGGSIYTSSSSISGTTDPALYQNERWGQFSYAIPVTNGTYDVRLHFVELYYGTVVTGSCVGKRIFGMDIVDTPGQDISNLDICAQVGPNAALVKTVSGVTVNDGVLNVQSVYGSVDDPELAAIEVVPH
jgi:hypothetical protein